MTDAHTACASWLGQSGQSNSRIEALYQAMEDQDMRAIRDMMAEMWKAAEDAILPAQASIGGRKRGEA